jgi:hypothetical protein
MGSSWNCGRGLSDNDKDSYLKKQLLLSYRCLALGVSKPQKEGYSYFFALPHNTLKLKVPVYIVKHVPAKLRLAEINCVSIVC